MFEIGSGTGQHACHFAEKMPHLTWQPTDVKDNIAGINSWVSESKLLNLRTCLELDVRHDEWPCKQIEALFSANTLHIMHWIEVKQFFSKLGNLITRDANVCIYGPFNYNDSFTSESNKNFDAWLKSRDSKSGIRDFEAILKLAKQAELALINDYAMPANNRLLHFKKH